MEQLIYNITPNQKNTKFLEKRFRNQLESSLKAITNCCEDFLSKKEKYEIIQKIIFICKNNQVSPFLYGLNKVLISSVKKENTELAKWCFNKILKHHFIEKKPKLNTTTILQNKTFKEIFYQSDEARFYDIKDFNTIPEKINLNYNRALKLFEIYMPNFIEEHFIFNKILLLFEKSNKIMGSNFNIFGLSYFTKKIFEKSSIDIIDVITHELGHHYLYTIFSIDPIILNDPNERFNNPFREEPRPMTGVCHGVIALCRILMALKTLELNKHQLTDFEKERLHILLEKYLPMFTAGVSVIKNHAKLTLNGKKLINSIIQQQKIITPS